MQAKAKILQIPYSYKVRNSSPYMNEYMNKYKQQKIKKSLSKSVYYENSPPSIRLDIENDSLINI